MPKDIALSSDVVVPCTRGEREVGTPKHAKIGVLEWVLGAIAIGSAALASIAYILRFRANPWGEPDSWGQFGDFVGGTVNPIVGIITIFLVVLTLRETRREAHATRQELEKQNLLISTQLDGERTHNAENLKHLADQMARIRIDAEAADVRRKVEGIIDTWNNHTAVARFSGVIGFDSDGITVAVNETLANIFEAGRYAKPMKRAREREAKDVTRRWQKHFDRAVSLLIELENALVEYEDYSESRSLTDYYRRRVAPAATLLGDVDLLPKVTAEGLAVMSIADALGVAGDDVGEGHLEKPPALS